jgi:5-methylcytosine-specific restriction endonuclease McrA
MGAAYNLYRKALRTRIAGEQGWRCCYCGARLEPETVTLEHVIPQAHGGGSTWDNLAASCAPCNGALGDFMPGKAKATSRRPTRGVKRPTLGDIWPLQSGMR